MKSFLAGRSSDEGFAKDTVRIMHATLRAMLNAAVDDGVILANPADRLGRQLRLTPSKTTRQEQIKAFNRPQLEAFLTAALACERRLYAFFFLLARTGLRLGEALALQWDDVDFPSASPGRTSHLQGVLEHPKSGHGRTVDMSQQLTETLRRLHAAQKAEKLRRGLPELAPWVFPSPAGTPHDHATSTRRSSAC